MQLFFSHKWAVKYAAKTCLLYTFAICCDLQLWPLWPLLVPLGRNLGSCGIPLCMAIQMHILWLKDFGVRDGNGPGHSLQPGWGRVGW